MQTSEAYLKQPRGTDRQINYHAGEGMPKGFIVCGLVNLIVAAILILVGLNFGSPVNLFFYVFGAFIAAPSMTIFLRTKAALKTSITSLSIASLISGFMLLYSIADVLDFNNSWLYSIGLCLAYFTLTFYLIGFKGYLKEATKDK